MKKILLTLTLAVLAGSAFADGYHHHHGYWQRGYNGGWNWVAPVIIGGVVGYEIARTQPPVVQQQPVIVQGAPVVVQQTCSPWTEIQNPDGTITRTRTCTQ